MAKCLGKSVDDIEEWVNECGTDVNCWLKKVGFEAIKCVPRCISEDLNVALSAVDNINKVTGTVTKTDDGMTSGVGNDFVNCMAKCLGQSVDNIEEWVKICGTDVQCWLKKVGFEAIKCVPHCISEDLIAALPAVDGTNDVTEKVTVGDNFVTCLAKCLGKSVAEIEEWVKECGKKAKCWAKKFGFAALKCVPKCAMATSAVGSNAHGFVNSWRYEVLTFGENH